MSDEDSDADSVDDDEFDAFLGTLKVPNLPTLFLSVFKWASSRENLSSGLRTKQVKNQSPQLQRLGRNLKFCS